MQKTNASQYLYQEGKWIKVGKTEAVIGDSPAPSGGGDFKHIFLTTYYLRPNSDAEPIRICRVNFVNFTSDDAGSKVFLFRKRRKTGKYNNHRKNWNHPLNYSEASTTGKKIMGLGFGVVAGTNTDPHGFHWLDINSYQTANGHNGFAQTEWAITAQDIQKGYIEINISEMMVDLLSYDVNNRRWQAYEWGSLDNAYRIVGAPTYRLEVVKGSKQITYSKADFALELLDFNSKEYKDIEFTRYQNKYYISARTFGFKIK